MASFGSRIRPDEVTPELRDRLARDQYLTETLALATTFIVTVVASLLVSLVYRWHGEPSGSEWTTIIPILAVGGVALIIVHFWYHSERQFVRQAPVAEAEVETVSGPVGLTHAEQVKLKYHPDRSSLPNLPPIETEETDAPVDTDAPAFRDELHQGDLVTVLYDPLHPEYVKVVEEEHEVETPEAKR